MLLRDLFNGVEHTLVQGTADREVADVVYDTRRLVPGALFVCIVGTSRDSHDLAADAVAAGAGVLVIQHDIPLPDASVTVIRVPSSRRAKSVPQRVISKGATCRRTSSSSVSRRASSSRPTRRSMRHTLWLMVLRYARLFSSVAYCSSS